MAPALSEGRSSRPYGADNLTPVVIARSLGVDLTTGSGLDEALVGVDAVVDASNVAALRAKSSVAFFEAATGHLLAAGERAGVRHHLAVSIVGSDRVDFGYYLGKRRQEELVRNGPVPWTIVRATQFHEFAGQILERSPGPGRVGPEDAEPAGLDAQLADLLVDVVLGDPVGRAPDVAGPEQHLIPDSPGASSVTRVDGRRSSPRRSPARPDARSPTAACCPPTAPRSCPGRTTTG